MGKALVLKAQIRQNLGSKEAVKLRKQGQIPAVIYGHKQESVAIAFNGHDFIEELHHGHRLMDVQIGKEPEKVLVKDVQVRRRPAVCLCGPL